MVPKENMTGFKRPGPATSPAPASEAPKSTKRARYSTALDCEIMEEVNGDNGLFNRGEKESKEKRWEMIADALQTALADKNESGSIPDAKLCASMLRTSTKSISSGSTRSASYQVR
jgi:hypothetical protein